MPIPTAYSEPDLQAYMYGVTGGLGAALGLDADDFAEVVTDVLMAYGVTEIAAATEIAKLRALARVAAWRTAAARATGQIDFTADGASFKSSQLLAQAQAALEAAEGDAMAYGALGGYAVTAATLAYPADPYPLPVLDGEFDPYA